MKRHTAFLFSLCIMACFFLSPSAHAVPLPDKIHSLSPVTFAHGATTLTIGDHAALITRGAFPTFGSAWGGDVYGILIQTDTNWQTARFEDGGFESAQIATQPHTYEDSIEDVYFLTSNAADAARLPDLYLLKAVRPYLSEKNTPAPTRVTFTLYQLAKDEDFRRIPFTETRCLGDGAALLQRRLGRSSGTRPAPAARRQRLRLP